MDYEGEMHGELFILRKDLLQDRVKGQSRDQKGDNRT